MAGGVQLVQVVEVIEAGVVDDARMWRPARKPAVVSASFPGGEGG